MKNTVTNGNIDLGRASVNPQNGLIAHLKEHDSSFSEFFNFMSNTCVDSETVGNAVLFYEHCMDGRKAQIFDTELEAIICELESSWKEGV